MRGRTRAALPAVGLLIPIAAPAATTLLPSDFRPVAAEGSARAAWVNPSGIGTAPWQSLIVEVSAREQLDGGFDAGELASLSIAASTGRTAYAFRRELDDVDGVPNWALLLANRVRRRNGMIFGSALEWRGGDSQSLDATVSVATALTKGLRASLVLEDVFESDVDGQSGSRRWRGGVALRPPGGVAYLSWDYDRLEEADEGRHWFGAGVDRGNKYLLAGALNDQGDWSARVGVRFRNARWAVALTEDPDGNRTAVASIDMMAASRTR